MLFPTTIVHGPVDQHLLRLLAPFRWDRANVDDPPPSLFLYDLSEEEQLKCLDAIDICCVEGSFQAVEIYLSNYEMLGQSLRDITRGLALIKLPRTLCADALTWLTILLLTASQEAQLSIVPIMQSTQATDEILRSISPYCKALLHEDSDTLDYADVISAFLHLPRTRGAERFMYPGHDIRAMRIE